MRREPLMLSLCHPGADIPHLLIATPHSIPPTFPSPPLKHLHATAMGLTFLGACARPAQARLGLPTRAIFRCTILKCLMAYFMIAVSRTDHNRLVHLLWRTEPLITKEDHCLIPQIKGIFHSLVLICKGNS